MRALCFTTNTIYYLLGLVSFLIAIALALTIRPHDYCVDPNWDSRGEADNCSLHVQPG